MKRIAHASANAVGRLRRSGQCQSAKCKCVLASRLSRLQKSFSFIFENSVCRARVPCQLSCSLSAGKLFFFRCVTQEDNTWEVELAYDLPIATQMKRVCDIANLQHEVGVLGILEAQSFCFFFSSCARLYMITHIAQDSWQYILFAPRCQRYVTQEALDTDLQLVY